MSHTDFWGPDGAAVRLGRVMLVCAGLPGCGDAPAPAKTALPDAPAGRLVFASDRDGPMAVYAVAEPGGEAERLSPVDGADWFPGPAGAEALAMLRAWNGPGDHHEEQLFLVSAGERPTPVGAAARAVRNPSWTVDGRVLLYESSAAGFRDVWTVRPGQPPIQRTASKDGCFEPRGMADGANMVMVCSGNDPDLRIVPLDGTEPEARPRWLLERAGEDLRPTPGGPDTRLAFFAEWKGVLSVWTVRSDGLGGGMAWRPDEHRSLVPEQAPAWSPDRRTLAVVTRRTSGAPEVWLLEMDRSGSVPGATGAPLPGIPTGHATESPTWMADGTILVTVDDGRNADIWRIDPRTGHAEVWVDHAATDWLPRWWPSAGVRIP